MRGLHRQPVRRGTRQAMLPVRSRRQTEAGATNLRVAAGSALAPVHVLPSRDRRCGATANPDAVEASAKRSCLSNSNAFFRFQSDRSLPMGCVVTAGTSASAWMRAEERWITSTQPLSPARTAVNDNGSREGTPAYVACADTISSL